MRKKLMVFTVAAAFAIALSGCGQGGTKSASNEYVKINNYNQLQIEEVAVTEVTDDDVDTEINSYLEAATEQNEVDRAAKNGDVANIDYVGKVDGKEFDGGSYEGYDLELGSGTFIGANGDYKGFEDQIVGHKAGEKFDIKVKFPETYSEELANKVATFTITLNQVKEKITPELDEAWVKENSEESKTVEEYKAEIKKQMEQSNEDDRKNTLQSRVLDALKDQIEIIEVPEEETEAVANQIRSTYEGYAAGYGMEFSDFLTQMGMTEEQFDAEVEEAAKNSAAVYLACELIAEKEKLTPSESEYQASYEEFATDNGYESVDEFLEDYDEENLKKIVLEEAVADYLVENAKQLSAEEMATATTQEDSSATDSADDSETDAGEDDAASADTQAKESSTEQ